MEDSIRFLLLIANVLTQLGVVGGLFNWYKGRQASRNALKCLLRAHIIATCCKALERGWIKMYEYENLTEMFAEYTALEGNGTVKPLFEQAIKLPHFPSHEHERGDDSWKC